MAFWQIALAVWFLIYALLNITNINFDHSHTVMGVLAAIVGIMIFVRK